MSFIFENQYIKKEFLVNKTGHYINGPIFNKVSNMNFVPDGNGSEFVVHFMDGDEISSKQTPITDTEKSNGIVKFTFEKKYGCAVSVTYCFGRNGKYLKKQISLIQYEEKPMDYILLENIGIINSETHYTIPEMTDADIDAFYFTLGQPFYVDSLFYGCEFPGTENKIIHGAGQIKYYLGKQTNGEFFCPETIIGVAKSNEFVDVREAFFNYIRTISTPAPYRVQYNSWYDHMLDIDSDTAEKSFYEIEKGLTSHGIAPLDAYVLDDGWNDYKADFWKFNSKFPNSLNDCSGAAQKLGSKFGLWLGPRGGYNYQRSFAKKIEKAGKGYYNADAGDICVGSERYLKNLSEFFVKTTNEFDIDYWKLDGFCLKPCTNSKHDHITGGEHEMYFVTELWERWIKVFKRLRKSREALGKNLWINMTCYVSPSPWWLRYVNSMWLQNSKDIGFLKTCDNQSQVDKEITYRDERYYDFLCARGLQFPTSRIYNHEPIYGNTAKVNYTDKEFEKYLFWNAIRGQAFNELYLSYNMMNEKKWQTLAKVTNWAKENHNVIRNATFLGGQPETNNIYGFTGFDEDGNGIVALRNPSDKKYSLTIALNRLMGTPENMKDMHRYNIFNLSSPDTDDLFSYGDKFDLSLLPSEVKIYQFSKTDPRKEYLKDVNDFSITFATSETGGLVCTNNEITVSVKAGVVEFTIGNDTMRSNNLASGDNHIVTLVREKNKMMKIYIDAMLDSSFYNADQKDKIDTSLVSNAKDFEVCDKAIPYDEVKAPVIESKKKRKLFSRKKDNE